VFQFVNRGLWNLAWWIVDRDLGRVVHQPFVPFRLEHLDEPVTLQEVIDLVELADADPHLLRDSFLCHRLDGSFALQATVHRVDAYRFDAEQGHPDVIDIVGNADLSGPAL